MFPINASLPWLWKIYSWEKRNKFDDLLWHFLVPWIPETCRYFCWLGGSTIWNWRNLHLLRVAWIIFTLNSEGWLKPSPFHITSRKQSLCSHEWANFIFPRLSWATIAGNKCLPMVNSLWSLGFCCLGRKLSANSNSMKTQATMA